MHIMHFYTLGNLYYFCWVFLAVAGFAFGAWYYAAKAREDWADVADAVESGPVQDLVRALDENKKYLSAAGENLAELKNELADKQRDLVGVERQLVGKETGLNMATIDLEKVRGQLAAKDKEIGTLEKDLMGAEAGVADREEMLANLDKAIAEKERLSRELERSLSGTQTADANTAGELDRLTAELNALKARLKELSDRQTLAKRNLDSRGQEAKDLQEAIAARETAIKDLSGKGAASKESAGQHRKAAQAEKEALNKLHRQIGDVDGKLAETEALTRIREQEIIQIEAQSQDRDRSEMEALRALLARLDGQEAELDREVRGLNRAIGEKTMHSKQLEESVGGVDNAEGKIDLLRREYARREQANRNHRAQIEARERDIQATIKAIREAGKSGGKNVAMLMEVKSLRSGLEAEKLRLAAELREVREALHRNQREEEETKGAVAGIEKALTGREASLKEVKSLQGQREKKLKGLKDKHEVESGLHAELLNGNADLTQQNDRLESELSTANERLAETKTKVDIVGDNLKNLDAELETKVEDKRRTKDEVDAAERAGNARRTDYAKLEKEVATLTAEVEKVEKARKAAEADASRLEVQIRGLEHNLGERDASLAELKVRTETSLKAKQSKEAEAGRLKSKVGELDSQVKDLLEAIKKAETEQSSITRTLGTTRDEHKKVSAELEELLSRLARVREQVT